MGKNSKAFDEPIYDARSLGTGRMLVLGVQHMFAMFGATVLVPIITGLDVSTTLLFAGLGTLLFHLITGRKVPAFLGSSFAFLGGYAAVAPLLEGGASNTELLPYACFGVAVSGLLYLVLAFLFKTFGAGRVMKFFPPVVTGPIIIAIGLNLAPSAINNCADNWNWIPAITAIAIVICCNIWGKGLIRIVPILLGVLGSYFVSAVMDALGVEMIDYSQVASAPWIGFPIHYENTVFSLFTKGFDSGVLITAVITIVPIAFATMMEHIGDISAISSTTGRNYIKDPGLHRTLIGDGLATALASLFGAPANTTYGENTGVLTLTKVYDPLVIRIAAVFAVLMSFCPKFAAIIETMPSGTIGGISLVLYGMISAVGIRNLVETHVDFSKSRNVLVAAMIMVLTIGISYSAGGSLPLPFGGVSLSGLATGSLVGILLNAVLPGKDYKFEDELPNATGVDFEMTQGESDELDKAQ